ncbi:MAG: hemerythrin domain-containing protein [Planctomycetota bacterium]|jgi:hypothetical protein
MEDKHSALRDAFLEDHRHLVQGFSRLVEALEADDLVTAVRVAGELDVAAGPHIEFEETVYYPQLARTMDRGDVDRLYHEHDLGLDAVRTLLAHDPQQPLEPEQKRRLIEESRTALEHAVSCGALLSHLTVLDERRQAEILEDLRSIRKRGRRWTERPTGAGPSSGGSA